MDRVTSSRSPPTTRTFEAGPEPMVPSRQRWRWGRFSPSSRDQRRTTGIPGIEPLDSKPPGGCPRACSHVRQSRHPLATSAMATRSRSPATCSTSGVSQVSTALLSQPWPMATRRMSWAIRLCREASPGSGLIPRLAQGGLRRSILRRLVEPPSRLRSPLGIRYRSIPLRSGSERMPQPGLVWSRH